MTSAISTKARACADLVRMDLSLGAGFFFVAGEILATGGVPPLNLAVFGFLALFFTAGSANISNDYFDRDVDRINLPSRPLPSGRISVPELWILFLCFTAAGMTCAAFLDSPVLVSIALLWSVALLYNLKLKEFGLFSNLIVAFCIALTVVLGGMTVGTINGVVLVFAALALFFDLGVEIAADAMDVRGDEARSSKSLAFIRGRTFAMQSSGVWLTVFFLVTPLPFLMGWLGYDYLILVGVTDLWMISCSVRLVRSQSIAEGRDQIRRLYLAWGLFVIVFTISRLL